MKNTIEKPKNKTFQKLPDGMSSVITGGEYRMVEHLFYSIWFFDDVYGCVVGDGDNGCYDFVLAQKTRSGWKIVKQSDSAYASTTYALRVLFVACDEKFGMI